MRTCSVDGCEGKHDARGYCGRHVQQFRKYGYIPERTRRDPNEIVIEGDVAYVHLYGRDNKKKAEAIIDYCDVGKVSAYKWAVTKPDNRVSTKINGKTVRIQYLLLGGKAGLEIDHINGNTLDNRRCNLRYTTRQQNTQNTRGHNPESGIKGVYRKRSKWAAEIWVNGSKIWLGSYDTISKAAKARKEAALKYHGEYAYENR